MNVEYLELDQQQQRVFARWLELYAVIREQLSTKYLVFSVVKAPIEGIKIYY